MTITTAERKSFGRWYVLTVAAVLLGIHSILLVASAPKHSPTLNEPAHLVAGISHWEFHRFELYRVNPPLVRMVAALPVIWLGYNANWTGFSEAPGARPEFAMGEAFVTANAERSVWLMTVARWACMPFSVAGGIFCFCWSRELWGSNCAGLVSLTLWCFDPNLLAHGELITPDSAATSIGLGAGYFFWRWLRTPTWRRALGAGILLGLAELSKMTWVILFALWPLLWLTWQTKMRMQRDGDVNTTGSRTYRKTQMCLIIIVGIYVLNLGYGFDGTFSRLGRFQFVSYALNGNLPSGMVGNCFERGVAIMTGANWVD